MVKPNNFFYLGRYLGWDTPGSLSTLKAIAGIVLLLLANTACSPADKEADDSAYKKAASQSKSEPAKSEPAQPFSEGLFWSIAKDGEIVAHLLGTFHSNDKKVIALVTDNMRERVQSSYSFSMEAFPGSRYFNPHWGFRNVIDDMMLPEGERLADLIGEDTYNDLENILVDLGSDPKRVARLRPWAAMNELGKLNLEREDDADEENQSPIMDHLFYEYAIDHVVDLYQLETLEELLAAYYDFPMDAQIALLKDRLAYYPHLPKTVAAMTTAYLNEDLQAMIDISQAFISEASIAQGYREVYLKHVLNIRNIVMAHYMLLPLRRKNAFIAVGALHLYGKDGLLSLLQNNYGFAVKRVALD